MQRIAAGWGTLSLAAILLTAALAAGAAAMVARVVRGARRRTAQARSQFQAAFDRTPAGMALCDRRGRLLDCNAAMAGIAGIDRGELVGRRLLDVFRPVHEEADGAMTKLVEGLAPGTTFDVRATRPDGEDAWCLVSGGPLDGATGVDGCLLVHVDDVTERRLVEHQLSHQATHDALTGLPNRTGLRQQLEQDLRPGAARACALLFVDLDRFKVVNDSLGHETGDALLVVVARRLRDLVRPGEVVARLGGDEFVVLARDVRTPEDAVAVSARILSALSRPVRLPNGSETVAGASIGIALADRTSDPESLLRDAETAMYRAKAAGGGRADVFLPSMRISAMRRHAIESSLRQSIDAGHLTVQYQPLFDLRTGRTHGAEALVRWHHPTLGAVGPEEFVPVAEESDLVVDLGAWVLDTALADLAEIRSAAGGAFSLSVNVSARQLIDQAFPAQLAAALELHGVPPQDLCLELTETALTGSLRAVVTGLHAIRGLGVRAAIDDFGTGHASLSYLAELPMDELKVDRVFATGLGTEPASAAIVGGVVSMAKPFGLDVVVEGIERIDQLAVAEELGADFAQGYALARPMTKGALVEALRSGTLTVPVTGTARRQVDLGVPVPRQRAAVEEAARYRMLLDLARDVTGRLDLDTILSRSFQALHEILEFTGGSIQLLDDQGCLRISAAEPPATTEALAARIPPGQGIGGSIVATGEPRYLPDICAHVEVSASRRRQSTSLGVRSYYGVPLMAEGRVVGLLQVDSVRPDAWDEQDRLAVLVLAPIVASAVQNARHVEREMAALLEPG